jgi:hypothetical protein
MKPTLEQIKTDCSVWPKGASACTYNKLTDSYEFVITGLIDDDFCITGDVLIIPRPTKAFVPEVGEWCSYKILGKWYKGFYVGKSIDGRVVMEDDIFPPTKCDDIEEFRPIKSDRELFVGAVKDEYKSFQWTIVDVAEALYDSGKFKLVEPTK